MPSAGKSWQPHHLCEWYDGAQADAEKIVAAINDASVPLIRYEGRDYVKDRELSSDEVLRMWRMMMVRKLLSQ